MPASAGMTLGMFIYEFSHSLIRRNDGVRENIILLLRSRVQVDQEVCAER